MDATWFPIVTVATVVAACSGAAAWWHHRQRVAQLRRRLADTEHSRLELADEALDLRQRLEAVDQALAAQKPTPGGDLAERRAALDRALDRAPSAVGSWIDTQPMTVAPDTQFEPTQPAELSTTR